MKRIFFTALLGCVISMQVFAIGGKCGEKVKWNFDKSTGVLTISGEGAMNYYEKPDDIPWRKYKELIKTVTVENGVTVITSYAFFSCRYVVSVSLPNSIVKINSNAFENCYYLYKVNFPNSLKYIGEYAFRYCKNLNNVSLPNSVTNMGNGVFWGCGKLKLITLSNSIQSIEPYTFNSCESLETITIPASVTKIGDNAFWGCKSLTFITIPSNVKEIGKSAFALCGNLNSITLSNKSLSIGDKAFDCGGIEEIHFNQGLYEWCTKNWDMFSSYLAWNKYSLYIDGQLTRELVIPENVTRLSKSAFAGCRSLEYVEIPGTVNRIEDNAFRWCTNLKTAVIHEGVRTIGNRAFFTSSQGPITIVVPKSVSSIDESAFATCQNLTVYTASSADFSKSKIGDNKLVLVAPEQLLYYYPYSVFVKEHVEKSINDWQKKGEFERTSDWQKRVTVQSRQQKIQALVKDAEQKYIAFHAKNIVISPKLGKYDADNEVFAMHDPCYGTLYMAVPYEEAPAFKNGWDAKQLTPQLSVSDDQIKIAALTISMPNGKQYTYRNTDAVSYNLAEAEYHFDPIELDVPKTSVPQDGKINIQRTTVQIGKSPVDTDIPVTNASNPQTFVIIFANEDYKNVSSVPFAKNDGSVFQKYCQKTLGIPVSNIHYVENASFNDMRIQLAWLKDVCDAFDGNASIIVYYAGHGIPDEASKSAYLLPVDGDGRYVQSAYNVDELYQKLGAMKAKSVTVFMDACFSGSKREQGMLASARGVALKAKAGIPQGNMVVFSAATGDETAYPDNDQQHGMFTYYLLKKLQETKGDVSLKDLGDYISTNVRQQSIVKNGKSQTPTVTPSAAVGAEWQNWKLK